MKKKLLAVLLATIGVSAYAAEDMKALSGFYVETGPMQAHIKTEGLSTSNTLVQVTGGYNIDKYAAVEVFAAKAINEDSKNTIYGPTNISVDQAYGAYLKGQYPVNEYFTPYVKVGVAKHTGKISIPGQSVSGSDTGFSYGVGANINITKQAYVGAGYTRLFKDSSGSVDAYNLTAGYKF